MDTPSGEHIEALRKQGLSYSEIGASFGISKDAARGKHARWASSRVAGADAPLPAALPLADALPPATRDGGGQPDLRRTDLNIGYFDLEATGLNGSFGRLHCGACEHDDGTTWVARIDDPEYQNLGEKSDDLKLAMAVRDHLETHDYIVSWNGRRGQNPKGRGGFDVPMLNTRIVMREERIMRSPAHLDLLPIARRHLQLHSYRLAAVQTFLELQEEKSAITPRIWQKALDYDREALDYIVDHNIRDVKVLKEVFDTFVKVGILRFVIQVAKT